MKTNLNTFEVLIVDQSGKSEITTVKSLVMGISYSEKLWKNPLISADESTIEDKEAGVVLHATKWDSSLNQGFSAFVVSATSNDFGLLEAFRDKLIAHLVQKLGFGTTRVLSDSISESISLDILTLLKKVEYATVSSVEKTLIQKEGLEWRGTNGQTGSPSRLSFSELSNAIKTKNVVNLSFKNRWEEFSALREKVLGNHSFSGQEYVSAELLANDLLKELGSAPVSLEQSRVPQEVQQISVPPATSFNETKFVEPKTEPKPVAQVEEIPPIVHNVAEEKQPELKAVEEKQPELKTPVQKEPEPVQAYATPVAEPQRQPVEQAPIGNEGNFDLISESVLLQELKTAQQNEGGKYVDLKAFVTKMLVPKGYGLGPTYMVAKNMDEKGLVKIYETKDEKGFSVRAIRVN